MNPGVCNGRQHEEVKLSVNRGCDNDTKMFHSDEDRGGSVQVNLWIE